MARHHFKKITVLPARRFLAGIIILAAGARR
jgi:hypothetical protein